MLFTLVLATWTGIVDVVAYVTGRFACRLGPFYWLKDSQGHVILPFVHDFDSAPDASRLWMMTFLMWSAAMAVGSVPLLYYYGGNRYRASGWAVSWANLVAVMVVGRVAFLGGLVYVFHAKFVQELTGSEGPLNLAEMVQLYRMKVLGWVMPWLMGNVGCCAVLLVMIIKSLRETNEWRRLNVRKIY